MPDLADGQQLPHVRLLVQGGYVLRIDYVHLPRLALEKEVLRELGNRARIAEQRGVLEAEFRRQRPLGPRQKLRGLAPGGDEFGLRPELGRFAHQVGVEAAAQALVGADQDDAPGGRIALFEKGMAEIPRSPPPVCPAPCSSDWRTGRPASAACWALRILEAATICIALVIWAVFLTDLMRRRMSRVLGMAAYL